MISKLKILIALNSILLLLIVGTLLFEGQKTEIKHEVANEFVLPDTASINKIVSGRNVLERKPDGSWVLNGKYKASPAKVKTMMAVLQRVEIKRPLEGAYRKQVKEVAKQQGVRTQIYSNDILVRDFLIHADNETEAIMMREGGEPFAVYIPGYFINVDEIFKVTESSWRDQRLLPTSWRTLKKLSVRYGGPMKQNSFDIHFDEENQFYKVAGIAEMDTAALYQYVSSLDRLRFNDVVERTTLRDSLEAFSPFSKVTLEDLSGEKSFDVYPTDKNVYVWLKNTDEIVTVSRQPMQDVLVTPQLFSAKK
ncbi:hypothetical protein V6R21_07490 [Limibacter armeniacum]|uniref:DUF4340 domain-containing protein n=1 Tax=Limibacter armeniacum TaxID=466084 RepID=UPI002FE648C5